MGYRETQAESSLQEVAATAARHYCKFLLTLCSQKAKEEVATPKVTSDDEVINQGGARSLIIHDIQYEDIAQVSAHTKIFYYVPLVLLRRFRWRNYCKCFRRRTLPCLLRQVHRHSSTHQNWLYRSSRKQKLLIRRRNCLPVRTLHK